MRATPKSWKAQPLPAERAQLNLARSLDSAEWEVVQLGFIPEEMEDKWFVYEEGGRLYFHRSWTGFCIYEVVFRETPAGQEVAEAWVSRERDQYSCVDDEYDARVLSWLIDVLLLKRSAPWPESGRGDEAVRQWSLVGRAMLAHDEDGSVAASLDRESRENRTPPEKDS